MKRHIYSIQIENILYLQKLLRIFKIYLNTLSSYLYQMTKQLAFTKTSTKIKLTHNNVTIFFLSG